MKIKIILGIIVMGLFLIGCNSNDATDDAVCDVDGGCGAGNDDDYVKIPLSEITSKIKKYSFNAGVEVKYFIVKGPDGEIRTAFDACDVCRGYKGYRQEGNDVTCNNCGRSFRISDIGTKNRGGGCWPSYLSHKIEGDSVWISKLEVARGAFRFR